MHSAALAHIDALFHKIVAMPANAHVPSKGLAMKQMRGHLNIDNGTASMLPRVVYTCGWGFKCWYGRYDIGKHSNYGEYGATIVLLLT